MGIHLMIYLHKIIIIIIIVVLILRRLGGFDTNYPTKGRVRPLGSESTYKGLTKSPTNEVITSVMGIELRSLWDSSLILINCANLHWLLMQNYRIRLI